MRDISFEQIWEFFHFYSWSVSFLLLWLLLTKWRIICWICLLYLFLLLFRRNDSYGIRSCFFLILALFAIDRRSYEFVEFFKLLNKIVLGFKFVLCELFLFHIVMNPQDLLNNLLCFLFTPLYNLKSDGLSIDLFVYSIILYCAKWREFRWTFLFLIFLKFDIIINSML